MQATEREMRAARFDRYGDPEVLEIRTVAVPAPGPAEVLVRVHAAGVNPKDGMIRSGAMGMLAGRSLPRGTGFDLAGEVVDTGPDADDLPPGTGVWGFLDGALGGAAADYVAVRRAWLAPMPPSLGWLEAAAIPLAGCAALEALRDVAYVRPGERVLIRGASGGVGSAAIQIARALGGRVTAMARGGGLDHCRALGADEVLDGEAADVTRHAGRYDVFVDCVGGSPLRTYGRLLAPGGRWVAVAPDLRVYALAALSRALAPMLRTPRLGFVVVRPRASDLEELGRLVDAGRLRMPITDSYPLEDIRHAHEALRVGPSRGKRVVAVSPEAHASPV